MVQWEDKTRGAKWMIFCARGDGLGCVAGHLKPGMLGHLKQISSPTWYCLSRTDDLEAVNSAVVL